MLISFNYITFLLKKLIVQFLELIIHSVIEVIDYRKMVYERF